MSGKIITERLVGSHHIMDMKTAYSIYTVPLPPFWHRVWFLISAVPRYLISGSVEVP